MKIRIVSLAALVCALLILFTACGEPKAHGQRIILDENGVTVVKNPSKPLNPDLQIVFEDELTIGVKEGDENYMFGNQILLNTDEAGNFYVTDQNRGEVKKYDSNGNFLRSIGHKGQGPGEFQSLSVVRFTGEGDIYLNDIKTQRLSFFTQQGDYLKGVKFPKLFERLALNSKGFYIARSVDNVELGNGKKWDYFYGLFDENFNSKAEFLRMPQEVNAKGKKADSVAQVLANFLSETAFQPDVQYVLDENDMVYFGYPENYEIKVYSPEGKLTKIIQRDFEPVEVRQRHKHYFKNSQSELFMAKIPPNEEDNVFEMVEYPKYLPAYEKFILMENGWIFVIVDSVRDGSALVDIFNEEGEYLAQFETDIPTDWLSFNNGKAYAVAAIDNYEYIKRYNFKILGSNDN